MAPSPVVQAAIVISAFLFPISLYFLFQRGVGAWKIPQTGAEAESKAGSAGDADAGPLPPPTRITRILIHPVKSCRGIEVESAKLLGTGLDLDRHWMWISHPNNTFLTIRNLSKMALITTSHNPQTDTLTITAPSSSSSSSPAPSLSIPAHPTPNWLAQNTSRLSTTIWSNSVPAYAYAPALTDPFIPFFGQPVRLVYKPPQDREPRALGSNGAAHLLGRKAATLFADMMPVLLGSEASLAELNGRLRDAGEKELRVGVERFRPNLVVRGHADAPWDEDRWKTVRIVDEGGGGEEQQERAITLDITQRCARCRVPNVDPETGEPHPEQPWEMLMGYRRVDEGITYKPCFGMLGVPRGEGVVRVGMRVEVTEVTRGHRYIVGF